MAHVSTRFNKYGESFLLQGRPDFYSKECVTLCLVTYKHNSFNFYNREYIRKSIPFQFSIMKSLHAEELVINVIEETEKAESSTAVSVELYSSFSPCKNCSILIQDFIKRRPKCKVHIAFTCLYRRHDESHNSALNDLNVLKNVLLLDIFKDKEWRLLRDKGILHLSPLALYKMHMWDCYWREELRKVIYAESQIEPNMAFMDENFFEYKTDGVTLVDHYNVSYVATNDELQEMDDLVKAGIRRQDRRRLMWLAMVVAIATVFIYSLF